MGTIVASEGLTIAISIVITTFTLGWTVFGIAWIRRAAKSLSPEPVKVTLPE